MKFCVKNCILSLIFSMVLLAGIIPSNSASASKAVSDAYLEEVIESIISWKKSDVGSSSDHPLLNDQFLQYAGSTPGDWFPIGVGRYGYPDDYQAYLSVITDYVNTKYGQKQKLDAIKATEWHRISLAITAMGGNPYSIGSYNGSPINLIADGTYNRGLVVSPGRQGINGWIWSLIALDSGRYTVPEDAYHTRQDFITAILKSQLEDGGLSLSGAVSDPDITAMAIQALAPYYNSELTYKFTSSKIKQKDENGEVLKDENNKEIYAEMTKTVRQTVDEGIKWLSSVQHDDGDFYSWGTQNSESTCQVLVALTALGIDPLHDKRFITSSGKTLLDGIMKYRLTGGGFLHTVNQTVSNSMASEQALYALVSLWRVHKGIRSLYDMRSEFTASEKSAIDEANAAMELLNENTTEEGVSEALEKYKAVDALNRCYVKNYWKLSPLVKRLGLELPEEKALFSGNGTGGEGLLTYFSSEDEQQALSLPSMDKLTTENYISVVTLFEKLKNAENKENYNNCYVFLEKAYNQIRLIQTEIEELKEDIKEQLYPFENIGLVKREAVYEIYNRYMSLSEYDRMQFEASDIEGLLKSKTQVDNLKTALLISVISILSAVGVTSIVLLGMRSRKKKKLALKMKESEE